MKNIPLLLGTILGTVLLIIGVAYFLSGGQQPTEAVTVDQAVLVADARNTAGPADAKITVVEFSDLQCPACRAAHPLVEQLKTQYPDVRFVYRHFPLDSLHPNARLAAQTAEVVADNGKFFEFVDLLFSKQQEWSNIAKKEELLNKFYDYTQELQLQIDKASFLEKIESQEVAERVNADVAIGNTVQINSTPTFYVNGKETPAPQLKSAVESAKNQQ